MNSIVLRGHTISSTALPNVALTKPPRVSPSRAAISSVAKERMAARGMMAKKLRVKTNVGFHSYVPAMSPKGTKTRRTFIQAGVPLLDNLHDMAQRQAR